MYITDGNLPDMSDGKVYELGELLFWVKLKNMMKQTSPKKRLGDPMAAHRLLPGMTTRAYTYIPNPKTLTLTCVWVCDRTTCKGSKRGDGLWHREQQVAVLVHG